MSKVFVALSMAAGLTGCATTRYLPLPHIPAHSGISVGGWGGSLTETYGSASGTVSIPPAWGGNAYFGLHFGAIFVDYNFAYLGVGKIGSASAVGNAYYFSPVGVNVGLSLSHMSGVLPLEIYAGYESGTLAFATGTHSQYSGSVMKGGMNLVFPAKAKDSLGLRAEYRFNSLGLSNSGTSPAGLGISSYSYFAGLVFNFWN